MKLFDRDYMSLTADEEEEWRNQQQKEVVGEFGSHAVRRSRFRDYPKAARHYRSLFPNNYLDVVELKDEQLLVDKVKCLRSLVDNKCVNERQILNFINENRAYFIVGALLKQYFTFGHHDAHLFREFPLGTSHKADYLLIGRSSGGWSFVFVELESPYGSITLANGEFGATIRSGQKQVADWDTWIDGNFASLKEIFNRYKSLNETLPDEFITLDKSRIHYVVIAGRRSDFSEKTYRLRRKTDRDNFQLILHYDNLLDAASEVIGKDTY
jgi:hypothetical protein